MKNLNITINPKIDEELTSEELSLIQNKSLIFDESANNIHLKDAKGHIYSINVPSQGTIGAQGAIGAQGTMGVQGTIGAQGTMGVQGTIGAQGAIGAQGPSIQSDWDETNTSSLAYIQNKPNINTKANKVANATNGNIACLDNNGDLTDSGIKITVVSELPANPNLNTLYIVQPS